jgi:hypothetical protein
MSIPLNQPYIRGPEKPLSLRTSEERDYYYPECWYFYNSSVARKEPLSVAIKFGNKQIIDLLLAESSLFFSLLYLRKDVYVNSSSGRCSPLRAAYARKDMDLVRTLLTRGASAYDSLYSTKEHSFSVLAIKAYKKGIPRG